MDHKKRDIKTAAAIIAIVKGQFLLLMFCILFCRVFELLDLIYRNYFLGRMRMNIWFVEVIKRTKNLSSHYF